MRKKFLYCFLALFTSIHITVSGQDLLELPDIKTTNVIPPSPQTRAFQIYGDIPVSHTTGVPDISIPLYTLKNGNIQIPIVLRYHTHSVKPFDADAGNLALGWVVDIGGMINRSIVGSPDELMNVVEPKRDFNENVESDYETLRFLAENWQDAQSDVFNYSLPTGESAKFYYNPNKGIDQPPFFLYPNTEAKITTNDFDTFNITDTKGFVYNFGGDYFEALESQPVTNNIPKSGWMLYKVTDPYSGKQVSYTYTKYLNTSESISRFYSATSMLFDEYPQCSNNNSWNFHLYVYGLHGDSPCSHTPGLGINYLEDNCFAAKKMDAVNKDCPAGYQTHKVSTITNGKETISFIYEGKNGESNKISKILITSGGVIIREIVFNIDRFPDKVAARRLKSVTINGVNGTPSETYGFEYNGFGWNSKASDYWGFYKGSSQDVYADNYTQERINVPFMCFSNGTPLNPPVITQSTARLGLYDLSPTAESVCNLLSKITYPTKGYTVFEYEPGKYDSGKLGGGPRVKSITDYSINGSNKTKDFIYENGHIADADPGNINEYNDPYKKTTLQIKQIGGMAPVRYTVRNTVVSNQVHPGLSIDIMYPTVNIVYKDGNNQYTEKFKYNVWSENSINYMHLADSGYPFIDIRNSNPLRGKLLKKEMYNSSNQLVQEEEYHYSVTVRDTINNLTVMRNIDGVGSFMERGKIITEGDSELLQYPVFSYEHSKVLIPNVQLTQKITTNYTKNGKLIQTEKNSYISESDTRITQKTILQSDKTEAGLTYTYPDNPSSPLTELVNKNMLGHIVETMLTKGTATSSVKNDYNVNGLITKVYSKKDGSSYIPRLDYTYDSKGNISSAGKTGDLPECYIWGYNYEYPVIKITGIRKTELDNMLGDLVLGIGQSSSNAELEVKFSNVKNLLSGKNVMITTYLYDSLFGNVTKITDATGKITTYEYDGFGRLTGTYLIVNGNKQKTEEVIYNYKK